MIPTLNEIFRETIELIKARLNVIRRLQQDIARYLVAAVVIRRAVDRFMAAHSVPGMSVAIAYKGRLVFSKGYGFADTATNEPVTTNHLFRIASLSKPITAAAVFRLLEERRFPVQVSEGPVPVLRLDEKVFGKDGILDTTTYAGTPPTGSNIDQITVQHLLEHTSGWRNIPFDIMFEPTHLNKTQHELISWMVANQLLANPPGTIHDYLNFGYLVLGRVIEVRSGMPYADYVRQAVLTPCGISDMHIAGNTLADRRSNEVHYYPGPGSPHNPYAIRVDRMDAHGGWIASPTDLVRFLVRVDRFPTPPDILTSSSILTMVTPTTAPNVKGSDANYAKGWAVHSKDPPGQGHYWHSGDLPGTAAFFIRTSGQYCVALLANSRDDATDPQKDQMMLDLDDLWWNIKNGVERGYPPDLVWPKGTSL